MLTQGIEPIRGAGVHAQTFEQIESAGLGWNAGSELEFAAMSHLVA